MITRFHVKGFKNLKDAELELGPVTCIAGPNGVGKSNFFDALLLLKALGDKSLAEACASVRGGEDPRYLFTQGGDDRMQLSADLLIPPNGTDDFNVAAHASSTFVTYEVCLRLDPERSGPQALVLESESLKYITKDEARRKLRFSKDQDWFNSVIHSGRSTDFISTDIEESLVKLHQDKPRENGSRSGGGRTFQFPLKNLPRTVLSSANNAQESQTAVLVRKTLRGISLLQLEPTALRRPDDFHTDPHLAADGSHLASTLYRLARERRDLDACALVANRLAQIIKGVRSLEVRRDEGLRRFILYLTDTSGAQFPAASLSDGTLRLLALAVLQIDPEATGIICLEEPENGIHPERISAMLSLLRDIAVDANEAGSPDNPLRQVVFNTHSPSVVRRVGRDELVYAEAGLQGMRFRGVANTWRTEKSPVPPIALGTLVRYLYPPTRHDATGTVGELADKWGTATSPEPGRCIA